MERAKSDVEEFQVVKKRRKYHGCGKEKTYKKRERGSNIIFPLILRLLGRSGEEDGNFGEEYQVVRNFIHTWFYPRLFAVVKSLLNEAAALSSVLYCGVKNWFTSTTLFTWSSLNNI